MNSTRPLRGPARPRTPSAVGIALLLLLVVSCATIAGLSNAGEALQAADFEIHDLRMEQDDVVHADLERPDGATDIEYFEQAAAIIWDHLEDQAQQAEIRLRGPDETDEIVTYSATELQEMRQQGAPD